MPNERRQNKRRKFGYYMRVLDNNTQEILGNLSDISPKGFRLESQKALTINQDYTLRLEQTSMVSDKSYIVLTPGLCGAKEFLLSRMSIAEVFRLPVFHGMRKIFFNTSWKSMAHPKTSS